MSIAHRAPAADEIAEL